MAATEGRVVIKNIGKKLLTPNESTKTWSRHLARSPLPIPLKKKCAANYKWDKENRKMNQGQDTPKQPLLTTNFKPFLA